jgi:hypothetical protein
VVDRTAQARQFDKGEAVENLNETRMSATRSAIAGRSGRREHDREQVDFVVVLVEPGIRGTSTMSHGQNGSRPREGQVGQTCPGIGDSYNRRSSKKASEPSQMPILFEGSSRSCPRARIPSNTMSVGLVHWPLLTNETSGRRAQQERWIGVRVAGLQSIF